MHVYRCVIYQSSAMSLELLVAHAQAPNPDQARELVRSELSTFGVRMHVGQLVQVSDFPLEYFSEKPVKLTRFSAGF